jgi:hypothetical protein
MSVVFCCCRREPLGGKVLIVVNRRQLSSGHYNQDGGIAGSCETHRLGECARRRKAARSDVVGGQWHCGGNGLRDQPMRAGTSSTCLRLPKPQCLGAIRCESPTTAAAQSTKRDHRCKTAQGPEATMAEGY